MLSVFGLSKKGEDHIENEDAFLIDRSKNLYAVADGVSIPFGGGIASKLFVKYLDRFFVGNLKNAFERANKKLIEERFSYPVGYTTCVAAYVNGLNVEVASVGDSVALKVHENDIELLNEIDRAFDGTLLQSLGDENINIHIKKTRVSSGDYLILTTDGISDFVSFENILEIVKKCCEVEEIAKKLVEEAERSMPIYRDDKTVVVIKWKD